MTEKKTGPTPRRPRAKTAAPVAPAPDPLDEITDDFEPISATEELLRKKRAVRGYVDIILEEIEPPGEDESEEAWETYHEAVRASTVRQYFKAIGRVRYDALIKQCPPTAEQIALAKAQGLPRPEYDGEKFAPMLIRASSDPPLSREFVDEIFNHPDMRWNTAELMDMFMKAVEVNSRTRTHVYLKGSGRNRT